MTTPVFVGFTRRYVWIGVLIGVVSCSMPKAFDLSYTIVDGDSMGNLYSQAGSTVGGCTLDGSLAALSTPLELYLPKTSEGRYPLWRRSKVVQMCAYDETKHFVGNVSIPTAIVREYVHPNYGEGFSIRADEKFGDLVQAPGIYYIQVTIASARSDYFWIEIREMLFDD